MSDNPMSPGAHRAQKAQRGSSAEHKGKSRLTSTLAPGENLKEKQVCKSVCFGKTVKKKLFIK